jgi:hypothetical protein
LTPGWSELPATDEPTPPPTPPILIRDEERDDPVHFCRTWSTNGKAEGVYTSGSQSCRCGRRFHALHRRGADLELSRDLAHPLPRHERGSDLGLDRLAYGWPPKPLPIGSGARQARIDPLPDHRALELGKDPHHLEERFARWGRGVDALLMQIELDALRVNLPKEANEMLQHRAIR